MDHSIDLSGENNTIYLTIHIDSITCSVLENLPNYIVDNIVQLFEAETTYQDHRDPGYDYYAIRIFIGGQYTLSEKPFWVMITENLHNAEALITAYINKLCELTEKKDSKESIDSFGPTPLIWSTQENPIGSFAIIAYLDRLYEAEGYSKPCSYIMFDTFIKFLNHCDMDHETWQHEYMTNMLYRFHVSKLDRDKDKLATLLYFRLFNGQSCVNAAEINCHYLRRFLAYNGGLFTIVNMIIKNLEDEDIYMDEYIYLKLCASAYGIDTEKIDEILEYVKRKLGEDELYPLTPGMQSEIAAIAKESNEALLANTKSYEEHKHHKSCPQIQNSGFHRYNFDAQEWETV